MPRAKKVPLHQFWCEKSQRNTMIGPDSVPRSSMWLGGQGTVFGATVLCPWESGVDSWTFWLEGRGGSLSKRSGNAWCHAKHTVALCHRNQGGGPPYGLAPTRGGLSRDPPGSARSYENPTGPVHPEIAQERCDVGPGTEAQNSVFH